MASTYTTNLRLTKQGDGDNPNTWGQVLNDGVISLIDDAVAGYTTVTIGSAASVTLTNNQGSGDKARSAILEFTGTVGGAATSIFVLIPNTPKVYVVKNSVSYNAGTNDVMLRVQGNTGCTVPADSTGMYVTNGTTVLPVAPTQFTNITASGNLAVDGTLTVGGAAQFDSTVTVAGAAQFQSTVTVGGKATFKNAVSVSADAVINGSTVLAGTARLDSTVTVAGAATFQSTVTIKGDVHVSSKVCASAFYGDGSNLSSVGKINQVRLGTAVCVSGDATNTAFETEGPANISDSGEIWASVSMTPTTTTSNILINSYGVISTDQTSGGNTSYFTGAWSFVWRITAGTTTLVRTIPISNPGTWPQNMAIGIDINAIDSPEVSTSCTYKITSNVARTDQGNTRYNVNGQGTSEMKNGKIMAQELLA